MMGYQEDSLTEPRLSVTQAAEYMGVTDAAVYIARKKGTLRPENVDGKWLFSIQQLDDYKVGNHPPPFSESDDMGQKGGDVLESDDVQPRDRTGRFLPKPRPTTTRYAAEREPEVTADSEKMPLCYRCERQFISTREYTIKKFIDETTAEPSWHPVCRDARCDPTVQNARLAYQEQLALKREQKRSVKLLTGLKAIRAEIDRLIAENEDATKETT